MKNNPPSINPDWLTFQTRKMDTSQGHEVSIIMLAKLFEYLPKMFR
jgi:hypothetical protein